MTWMIDTAMLCEDALNRAKLPNKRQGYIGADYPMSSWAGLRVVSTQETMHCDRAELKSLAVSQRTFSLGLRELRPADDFSRTESIARRHIKQRCRCA